MTLDVEALVHVGAFIAEMRQEHTNILEQRFVRHRLEQLLNADAPWRNSRGLCIIRGRGYDAAELSEERALNALATGGVKDGDALRVVLTGHFDTSKNQYIGAKPLCRVLHIGCHAHIVMVRNRNRRDLPCNGLFHE
jgi:hypothetical protein